MSWSNLLKRLYRRTRLLQAAQRLRRRVGRAVEPLVGRTTLRSYRLTGLPPARCDFFQVLEGRTLHVHALLPPPADAAADRADLLFVRDQRVLRCPARIRSGAGQVSVEAMASLGDEADEVVLAKGTWSLGIAMARGQRIEQRYALRVQGAQERDGPTVLSPPHPVSGRRYIPVRGAHGLAQVKVTGAKPRAEVVRLVHSGATARIQARLINVRSLDNPAVVFVPRQGGPECTVPIYPADDCFDLVVPLARLASGPPGVEVIWDTWVRVSATRMIHFGRYLHDLRDPRTVFRVSRVTIAIDEYQFVGYRPYYTKAGNLVVACVRSTRFVGTDE